jgi:hypothetical protein
MMAAAASKPDKAWQANLPAQLKQHLGMEEQTAVAWAGAVGAQEAWAWGSHFCLGRPGRTEVVSPEADVAGLSVGASVELLSYRAAG